MRQGPTGTSDGPRRPSEEPRPFRPQPVPPQWQPPAAPTGPGSRPTVRDALVSVAIGLLLAVVVSGVTAAVLAGRGPSYVAQAQLALVPVAGASPADTLAVAGLLSNDQPGKTAAVVLTAPSTVSAAARAAQVDAAGVEVTATPTAGTGAITLAVRAATSAAATDVAQRLIEGATPQIQNVSGPFSVEVVSPPADDVTATSPVSVLVLLAAGVVALLLGTAATACVCLRRAAQRTN